MGNRYIEQRDAIRKEFFLAGMELEGQRTVDMLCLVLHDPEIMGKNAFGAERLKTVVKAIQEREETFREAFLNNPESDWWQEALDRGLREIFGDKLEPFEKRYPNRKNGTTERRGRNENRMAREVAAGCERR